ncbi:hypothetical protein SKAU_G00367300 [Synaphobranchus kaupii]|uniref:Uncharacterized protein n=1 Tax=Synaphobranchus kaupii TaxID=118154 RepID=A0A9Q1EFC7_SYNKA|nr:hypothetical protein SKAU_G00367300 [Synaphobranchus kaupii]
MLLTPRPPGKTRDFQDPLVSSPVIGSRRVLTARAHGGRSDGSLTERYHGRKGGPSDCTRRFKTAASRSRFRTDEFGKRLNSARFFILLRKCACARVRWLPFRQEGLRPMTPAVCPVPCLRTPQTAALSPALHNRFGLEVH